MCWNLVGFGEEGYFQEEKEQKDTKPEVLQGRLVVRKEHISVGILGSVRTGDVTRGYNTCLAFMSPGF